MLLFGAATAAPNKGTPILNLSRSSLTTEYSKIQGLFNALQWFSSHLQGRFNFQGFFKKALYIQVLFNLANPETVLDQTTLSDLGPFYLHIFFLSDTSTRSSLIWDYFVCTWIYCHSNLVLALKALDKDCCPFKYTMFGMRGSLKNIFFIFLAATKCNYFSRCYTTTAIMLSTDDILLGSSGNSLHAW